MGRAKSRPYRLMAKKQEIKAEVKESKELTDLEKIEAEMSEISPTLKDLKKNNPAKYKEVYRHYMWLVGERDRLANG